jgi:two-component system response regulator AtoC
MCAETFVRNDPSPPFPELALVSCSGAALGAPAEAYELVLAGPGGLRTHVLPVRGTFVLGRAPEADVDLPDPHASPRHARLYLLAGLRAFIEDLGSERGTWILSGRILPRARVPVAPGQVVLLGGAVMVLQVASPDRAPAGRACEPGEVRPPSSTSMARLEALARSAAGSTLNVLLMGETGVGKDVIARRIHGMSPRRDRSFLKVDCAALSPGLLESELFGHERGAFTGATTAKRGLLECAPGGTVLLDEIGELPMALQAKLLNVVEAKEVVPLGALRPRPIDVRFLSATNRLLWNEASQGTFRLDLYYRLAGLSLVIPPLRERRDEIAGLASLFIAEISGAQKRAIVPTLSAAARAVLEAHSWPGNIRELKNVIERASLLCGGGCVEPDHLLFDVAPGESRGVEVVAGPPPSERQRILDALEFCAGNQTRAAKLLGIARSTLTLRLAAYDVPRPRRRKR